MQDTGKMPYAIHDQFTGEATVEKVHSYITESTMDHQYKGQLGHAI